MYTFINKLRSLFMSWAGLLKREIESLIIAAQNNTMRTNCIKAKLDNRQENNKCRLYSDKDDTINHSKQTQREYKNKHH